jgi:PelA/Pel-15E family pectate lyase
VHQIIRRKTCILLLALNYVANVAIAQSNALTANPPSQVKLTEVDWHGTDCYRIEMPMGTVYFEKGGGVSGFKSFIDPDGNDWIASYLPPGPNGNFRGFPNSVGNFGHAGRDSGSTTKIVDGITEGNVVILESSNEKFSFQYWFFADRITVKVLKSEGDYTFLWEGVAGGSADSEDYFVTADGKKRIPSGEFWDFSPEWLYIGDPKSKYVQFLAKTPDDDAPNENHRQIRPSGEHNMDLYSFGRTGKEHQYSVQGMSGNDHIAVIGFARAGQPHNQIAAKIESYLAEPFQSGVRPKSVWSIDLLDKETDWFDSDEARAMADNVIQYQSPQGGWPKSTDIARAPLTENDIPKPGSGRANTFDNDATTVPMEFLAKIIAANPKANNSRYKKSFKRGLDYIFKSQYPSGGWPQYWPLRGDEYYSRVTFNDEAMIHVLELLQGIAKEEAQYEFVDRKRRKKAAKAVELGIEYILKAQVRQNGVLTAWCAQHHEETFEPAWARAYEPPSLSGQESVGITRFLMSIDDPSPEVINAVNSAIAWFEEVAIPETRLDVILRPDGRRERVISHDSDAPLLWARFYELGTNRPLYLDRDSVFRYNYNEVGYERRSGYSYHGHWAEPLLTEHYPAWQAKHFAR